LSGFAARAREVLHVDVVLDVIRFGIVVAGLGLLFLGVLRLVCMFLSEMKLERFLVLMSGLPLGEKGQVQVVDKFPLLGGLLFRRAQ
jgi:hypothetical protein